MNSAYSRIRTIKIGKPLECSLPLSLVNWFAIEEDLNNLCFVLYFPNKRYRFECKRVSSLAPSNQHADL